MDVSEVIIKSQFSIMAQFSRKSQVESICFWQLTKLSLKEIEKYAKENNLEVGEEIKSYSPAMLLKYYKWVGSGNNPCVVSRPWKYNK